VRKDTTALTWDVSLAVQWIKALRRRKLDIAVSPEVATKRISLAMENTLAECLRRISDACGCSYRVAGGRILFSTPEHFAAMDARKATFKPWVQPSLGASRPK
jgi:hypothetical protein